MTAQQCWTRKHLALGAILLAASCTTPAPPQADRASSVVAPPSTVGLASVKGAENQHPRALLQVDRLLREAVKPTDPGCSIGASRMGQPIFEAGYGLANLETRTANEAATIYHASSMAKQFTALAVMLLVSDGKITLEDDARAYVPELPDFGHKVTIRHLLSHTSGLRDISEPVALAIGFRFYDYAKNWNDVLYYLSRQQSLNFAPGTEHSYSNTGYLVASLIVERVAGKALPEFAEERIFNPLGMSRSSIYDDYTVVVPESATGYERGDDGEWHESIPRSNVTGPSNLMTTVGDLLKWHEEVRRPRLFRRELQIMREPVRLNDLRQVPEGLGIHLEPFRGSAFAYHGGGDAGHESFSGVLTESGVALALLCNQFGIDADFLGRKSLALTAELPGERHDSDERRLSPAELQARAGIYASRGTGEVFYIRVDDGQLAFGQKSGPKLIPLAEDLYRVGSIRTVQFLPTAKGRVDRIVVRIGSSRTPVVAHRLTEPAVPLSKLSAYAGRFRSEESNATYEVRPNEGNLEFRLDQWGSFTVKPVSGDIFKGYFMADFARDRRGRITGVFLSTDRSRRIWLRRLSTKARHPSEQ